jgi:hypothetical protein
MAKNDFQDEVVLPSGGTFYPAGLIPGGTVVIRMMTTQEEKLLSGGRGSGARMISQLLDRVIVRPEGLKSTDLLLADRLFLLIKLRILTFGSNYGFKVTCSSCETNTRHEVSLADQQVKMLPTGVVEPFEVTLPQCGERVYLRFLRGYDEEFVSSLVKKNAELGRGGVVGDPAYLPNMARTIHHTDSIGEDDFPEKLKFVQELYSPDSLAMTQALEEYDFGVDMKHDITCPVCGATSEIALPFSEEFFRPKLCRAH